MMNSDDRNMSSSLAKITNQDNALKATFFGILLTAIVLCYVPMIWGDIHSKIERSRTQFILQGSVSGAAVAIPLFIDSVIEPGLKQEDITSRVFIAMSLLVPNAVNYIYGKGREFSLSIYVCSTYSRHVLLATGCLYSCNAMSWRIKVVFGVLYSFISVSYSLIPFLEVSVLSMVTYDALTFDMRQDKMVLGTITYIVYFPTVVATIAYALESVRQFISGSAQCSEQSMVNLLMITCNMILNFLVVVCFGYNSWSDTSVGEWLTQLAVDICCALLAFQVSGYFAKREVVRTKVRAQEKKNFIRYLYHDLRTPLQTISIGTELLRKYLPESWLPGGTCHQQSEKWEEDAQDVLVSMDNCLKLVFSVLDNLWTMELIEENQLDINISLTPLSVKALVSACIDAHAEQAKDAGISLECVYDPSAMNSAVRTDEKRVRTVMDVLVGNAVQHSPRGGRVVVVVGVVPIKSSEYFATTQKESRLRWDSRIWPRDHDVVCGMHPLPCALHFEVRDTGQGMGKVQCERVLSERMLFNSADMQRGKGLGFDLYISRCVIDRLKGRIWVDSDGISGEGCIFSFEIPMNAQDGGELLADPATNLTAAEARYISTGRYPSTGADNVMIAGETLPSKPIAIDCGNDVSERHSAIHVLVVDDSHMTRKVMTRVLKEVGVELIDEAADGIEAVLKVTGMMTSGKAYDAIFMDSIMPYLGGIPATIIIRLKLGYSGPIFAVTGNALPDDVHEFQEAGITDIYIKPVKMETIRAIIDQYVLRLRCKTTCNL